MKGPLTRFFLPTLFVMSLAACGGGGKKPASSADDGKGDDKSDGKSAEGEGKSDGKADKGDGEGKGDGEEGKPKASICTGFELDLVNALNNSACEVQGAKAMEVKAIDMKKSLVVKLTPSSNKVEPGGKVDLIVQFSNKGPKPLELDFLLDPTPRFQVEAYDAKNKAVHKPATTEPLFPSSVDSSPQTVGRVTIVPNGSAHAKVVWDASKMRWAPEKVKGTPREMGYPRVPAGPLPKGKYTVKVITPLLNAAEGIDKEMSAPKTMVEVGK